MISANFSLKYANNVIDLSYSNNSTYPITFNNTVLFDFKKFSDFNENFLKMLNFISDNINNIENLKSCYFDVVANKGFGFVYFSFNSGIIIFLSRYKGDIPTFATLKCSNIEDIKGLINDLTNFESLILKIE